MARNSTHRVRGDGASLPDWLHIAALIAAFLAGVLAFPLASKAAPAVGTAAPDFALKATDGKNLRLSEYRGDLVVVTFWATWCGECRQALSALNSVGTAASSPPVVLSVNIDADAPRAEAIAKSAGFTHPTLLDTHQQVGRLYTVDHLPVTLLIDREGVVRGSWSHGEIPGAELNALLKELAGT
jgi:peroxiredoxin